jgi:quercetin dioxygenase-like cupin family protein
MERVETHQQRAKTDARRDFGAEFAHGVEAGAAIEAHGAQRRDESDRPRAGEPRTDIRIVHADEMQRVEGASLRGLMAAMVDVEASRLEFFVGTFVKGLVHRSPAHQHGVVEHIFLHRGRLRVGPEGKEAEIAAGDYMRMEADRPHAYEALSDDLYFTLVMQIPTNWRA